MHHASQSTRTVTATVLGAVALFACTAPRSATADEVFDWNRKGFEATAAGGQNAILVSRTMTIMHLAVHDALNAVDRRYEPYLYQARAEQPADANAAIAAAARDSLAGVIPEWGKPDQQAKALGRVDGMG